MTPVESFIAATKFRAKAYVFLYEEMVKEIGEEKADKIFSKATYRLGEDKALNYNAISKTNAAELAKIFVSDPIGNKVFDQEVIEADNDHAVIEMKNCPLVDMWKEMNLPLENIKKMCDLAYKIDFGNIEKLGYKLKFSHRISYNNKSCILEISKNK